MPKTLNLFSKGYALLNVDAIYCTDSFKHIESADENIKVFSVLKYIGY
jgi:hypothetical protein